MKDTTFSIRITSDDLDTIKQKAKQARLSQSDYVTRCCLGRQVVVVEDLKEVLKQQRAIGNNLNQLTVLANMGRVSITNLGETAQALKTISETLPSEGGGRNSHHQLYELPQGAEPPLHGGGHGVHKAGGKNAVAGAVSGQRNQLSARERL